MNAQNNKVISLESKDGLNISQRIKLLRNVNDMNQQEFAQFVGISQSQISAIEIGVRNPSKKLLQLIAEKCNCSVQWLENGISLTDIIQEENDTLKRAEKDKIVSILQKMSAESLYYLRRQAELIYNLQMEKESQSGLAEMIKKYEK